MTPNPDSPLFIKHEVPEYACDNSKKLSQYFFLLRGEIVNNRWNGITPNDITLTYNTYDGCTEVEINFKDKNNHKHHFIIRLIPNNGFRDTDEDDLKLLYLFEGVFDENALTIRSFAEYLSDYLSYEGFEPTLINCDKWLSIPCTVEYLYQDVCKLIDITLPLIKPLVWFYNKEPNLQSFDEAFYYLAGVKSQFQLECCKGRWENVKPECFKILKYETEREISLGLKYIVEDVWELYISIDVTDCEDYFDIYCSFNCYPDNRLTSTIRKQLEILFADFLTTIKISRGNTYVCCGNYKQSVIIQYFHIEDTFDILCTMLDEIVPALQSFTLQLPLQPINLTREIEAIKEQMETILNTTFEVITEEQQINKKLKNGYYSI